MSELTNLQKREKVFDMCDTLGFWNVRPVLTGKELGTAHQNIVRWKKQYIDKFGIPNIKKFGAEANVNSQTALKELIKLMKSEKGSIRIRAIDTYFNSLDKFTRILESFEFKDKIPDKHIIDRPIEVIVDDRTQKRNIEDNDKLQTPQETE